MIEWYVEQASTYAADIDGLILLIAVIVGFWFVLAELLRFGLARRGRGRDGVPAQYITGEEKWQIRCVTIPLVLIVVCDIYIAMSDGPVWDKVKQYQPEPAAVVRAIGQQWAWTFVHPGPDLQLDTADDIETVGDLHVEVNKVYHIELMSLDVLHSFSVPVFRLKQDVIPGRVITGWFEATRTGAYDIQCTEICGSGRALMPGRIVIESAEEHAAWNSKNSTISVAAINLPQNVED